MTRSKPLVPPPPDPMKVLPEDAGYRRMIDSVSDYAIFMLDPTGHILSWNAGAEKIKGWTAEEVLGRHFTMFYPPELIACDWAGHELRMAAENGRFEDEGWRLRRDGTRFWASVIITRLGGADGSLRGFAKITRDLSDKRAQDERLRLSEENFRLLVEGVRDHAIFMLDPSGHIVSWNTGAQNTKGYTASEIIGKHFSVFYPAEVVASGWPEEELRRALRDGRCEDEGWRLRKDGSRFWANVTITSLHDESGRHRGFAKVTRDMTDRRRVSMLEDEGRRTTAFLAMLGHELRNPLAPIANALSLLQLEEHPGATIEMARDVLARQLRQLTRIVDDLLDVGRITSGKIRLQRKPVPIAEVVAEALEAVSDALRLKGHTLREDVTPGLWVTGDRVRLVQVLTNLLGNAVKFTPPQGAIEVYARLDGESVQIGVSDNGPGVKPEDLPHIFELFVQTEPDEARTHGGLGLGLSLVRQLVRLHEGDVAAFSTGEPGKGVEFVVRLPRAQAPHGTEPVHAASHSVLVVDDNRDAAATLVLVLQRLGYHAAAVHDGPAAVEAIRDQAPAVVLLDLGLPGLGGIAVAQRVQAEVARPPQFVAVTGYGQESDREATFKAGFAAHLTKPLDPAELARVLRRLFA